MPNYLILKRTGPGELDLQPAAVIRGKTAEEVDDAIREGAQLGAGRYVAQSMASQVERDVALEPTVTEPSD